MILVTGASGVVGRALVDALADTGEAVTTLSRAEVDLRDQQATERILREIKPSVVYHLAARVHGLGGNTTFPAEMFTDNIRINTNVIDASRLAGCKKVVAVSTVATYSSTHRPSQEKDIWEGAPHGSEAAYAHAKRAMLAQLEAYSRQYGLDYAYPILTNIYGPFDRFDPVNGHVIPSLVAKFHAAKTQGDPVVVWGSGRAQRDFLYSDDAAAALALIGARANGPINVASGSVIPIRRVVDVLRDITGVSDIRWDASRPDGQLERSYDIQRLSALEFRPRVSFEDGLNRTYTWFAAHAGQARS